MPPGLGSNPRWITNFLVVRELNKMINNSHDLLRSHLKQYLGDISITMSQIKNIAAGYHIKQVHCLPRDLVRQKFLVKHGSKFRVSKFVVNA